jgi:NSS family neurotransmitter:Na+ symporter
VAVTTLVVLGGIQNGIERWSKILMPLLLFILVLLMVRSVTLPGAATGLAFYLNPDFSKVSFKSVLDAISQAFFSLSLGMGIMITYGSYLKKDSDVVSSTFWICLADSSIAVLAGFVIFPALFTIPGLQPTQGANLIFLVLPSIFDKLPGGTLFGTGFFALLALAALTSSISLLEVVVSFCMDTLNWTRKKSVFAAGMAVFLLGLPSALAANAVPSLSKLPLLGMSFLDLMDAVFGKLCLTITALAICIFVGWRWGVDAALEGLAQPAWVLRFWSFLLRVACPILILTILIGLLV